MKQFILMLCTAFVLVSCNDQAKQSAPIVTETPKEISPKEVFLDKQDSFTQGMISVIDSIVPVYPALAMSYESKNILLDTGSGKS